MKNEDVEVLTGGHSHPGQLIRIGDRVHRPMGPYSPSVHGYLRHLERAGFEGSPRVHGTDAQGREILDFVRGDVPCPPLPAWVATGRTLASVARLLRRLHDAAASYRAPADAVWHQPVPPREWAGTVVCHNDLVPDNVVCRNGLAVALIDFDLCAPVDPLWDVAVAIRHWLPVRDECDLERIHAGIRPGPRLALFCDEYGLPVTDRVRLLDAVMDCCVYAYDFVRAKAAEGHPAWVRAMAEGRCERHLRSVRWLRRHRGELQAWLV
ncbi:phosphotransferase [Actinomadura fulvescens]|uniref:Phosphotransferase n=1 Tax=Actinomadura fulvescens TaxID=46160 RepID=A0ABN3PS23_9ACTN